MQYQYKTVPTPMALSIKNQKEAEGAIRQFGELISAEAVDGWEFHSMETITTSEAPGCFGGGQSKETRYNMLVFKRETVADTEDDEE